MLLTDWVSQIHDDIFFTLKTEGCRFKPGMIEKYLTKTKQNCCKLITNRYISRFYK